LDERFAVAESVLEGERQPVVRQAVPELTRDAFRLPGFDEDNGMFCPGAIMRIVRGADGESFFVPRGIHQARAVPLQGFDAFLPRTQHRDLVSCLC
jgi:hypothetical protein